MKHLLLLGCGLSLAALAGCNNSGTDTTSTASNSTAGAAGAGGAGGAKKYTVVVIPKGSTHAYWKSVKAGADKAGKELDANIVFKAPVKESDRSGQIGLVDQFVSQNTTSAIVLAPLDDVALVKPVRSARDKKIPVVIIDSAIKAQVGTDYTSYVATDNFKGGVLGGEQLVKLLGGKGKVVLLRYDVGSASTADRENGFMSVMKKNPGITIISENQYAGSTAGEAKTKALGMVDKLKEANGLFTPNETSTQGTLLALRQIGVAGKIKFVGFDASAPLLEALGKGEINALVAQNPTKMGYDGVKTAVAALKGEKFEQKIDTGVAVITKENRNSPEVKEVLNENGDKA